MSLREVTGETVGAVCALEVRPDQRGFVASNALSIAEAHFEPHGWFRAIYADETPVGFLMVYEDAEAGEFHLWRFMVDAEHQGKGYARGALDLLVDELRSRGVPHLMLSYVDGELGPAGFYRKYGFAETGEVDHGEIVMRLDL